MRLLLATTGLGTIAAALVGAPAYAQTVISTATTAPLVTSTAGNVEVTSTGSIKPASGIAVTIDSSNSVDNKGTIAISGANNSAGIVANPGFTGNISNSGTITIDENFTPADSDNDGDADGPFAQGTGRFGIRVLPGGTFTGNIVNSGTITVEGNASTGIAVDSALTGSLSSSGTINVIGDNSAGIRLSDVSGNVTLGKGIIAAQGANAIGVALNGDIGGALVVQNTIRTSGYRLVSRPADTSKLDADDLLQGGPALVVGGNVAGGILLDAPPADNSTTDTDEDDDGIADAQETTATVESLGAAPAILIGSATDSVSIGAVAGGGGKGVVIRGNVRGIGIYDGVTANGLTVGGLGGTVNVTGGISVAGTVSAKAIDANATAIRIGSGATVPEIDVSGTVAAEGAGTASSAAQAILIDSGASVSTIRNSGTVSAKRSGTEGSAAAIVDKSGTVTLIENSGTIGVTNAATLGDKATAFDLSANATGVTVRQLAAASGKPAPSISGDMLFGTGSDIFEVGDGTVTGTAKFGTGANRLTLTGDAEMTGGVQFGGGGDIVQLGGTSALTGDIDFGGGADTLTLAGTSVFTGRLSNSAGLAVTVGSGSTLGVTNNGTVDLASLTTGSGSTIGVALDPSAGGNTLYNISGAADFGTDTTVEVTLLSLGDVEGTYTILQAGSLTGAANLDSTVGTLPILFDSTLSTTGTQVSLEIRQRSADELGLNRSEGAILDAVIGAADADASIQSVFLGLEDTDSLRATLQQMLPNHAGGTFEAATKGSRLLGRALLDPQLSAPDRAPLNLWFQQTVWGSSKAIGDTSSYDVTGWGATAGLETGLGGLGSGGFLLSYFNGRDTKPGDNELTSNQFEGGLFWRGGSGPLRGFARASAGRVSFDNVRRFEGLVGDGSTVSREADGDWKGTVYSAMAGVSYDARMGRLSLRPAATLEHFKLTEKGYSESGGGDAFNLSVAKRSSDETAATGTIALGYQLMGASDPSANWLRIELEGGRRQILSGDLGETVARFEDGDPFTLTPEERTSGWLGALRLLGGGPAAVLTGEVNAEEQQDDLSIGGRFGLRMSL